MIEPTTSSEPVEDAATVPAFNELLDSLRDSVELKVNKRGPELEELPVTGTPTSSVPSSSPLPTTQASPPSSAPENFTETLENRKETELPTPPTRVNQTFSPSQLTFRCHSACPVYKNKLHKCQQRECNGPNRCYRCDQAGITPHVLAKRDFCEGCCHEECAGGCNGSRASDCFVRFDSAVN
ncbi:unnamed protein product [Dibothriocephalus latus]|uniref:Uncharacterized protein n=1 Tax=Dibothriocephalus latus TaxID=60516 RepID=A0A3P7MWB2_DIBLA|nr:unnamed protein product [Dibothriocephalus latus]